MDYEKAYNEALERAKRLRDSFYQTMNAKRVVEEIFPELRESEDERMIRILKEGLEGLTVFNYTPVDKILDWLEKQKEHQENCTKFLAKILKHSAEGFRNILKKKGIDYIPNESFWTGTAGTFSKQECNEFYKWMDDMTMELVTEETPEYKKGFRDGLDASKKEQKPAESISRLTVQGKGVYKICPRCKERMVRDDSKVYTSMPPQYGYNCPKCGTMEFDTVMYDNPEMEEQKPAECADDVVEEAEEYTSKVACGEYGVEVTEAYIAGVLSERNRGTEWSEEDKEMLLSIINAFRNGTVSTIGQEQWLKSLPERFSLQSKPEWSEEDRLILDSIIAVVEEWEDTQSDKEKAYYGATTKSDWLKSLRLHPKAELTLLDENIIEAAVAFVEQNDHFNVWRGIDKHTVLKALRSLQPHWKPSEEQMSALNYFIKLWGNSDDQLEYTKIFNTVKSLRDDLKKQM